MKLTKKLLTGFVAIVAALVLVACDFGAAPVVNKPVFAGVGPVTHQVNTPFDPLAGVTASDEEDGDLTDDIVITANTVNVDFLGVYSVSYSVTDSDGNTTTANRAVTVTWSEVPPLAQYLSGVDLGQLPAEEKAKLFAAVETYLLDNVYAGIPLYTGASRVIYSDRVQLFTDTYNGVMGYGTAYSQFSADDSTVLMFGDTYGNAGEYTWRSAFTTNPSTFNPWTADDSNSDDFISMFTGGLYEFYFDDTKTSYEINPALAASDPVPTGGYELNGRTYAKVWRVTLKDGLEWSFHPDTDTSGFAAGYEVLDANDYLWTWKKALQESWFRAISGGGDFISMGIKGAAEYAAAPTEENWAKVGIRKIDDLTFELEFISDTSQFDVKYSLAGNSKPALQPELYTALGKEGYGLGPTTVASSGIYILDTYSAGQLITYVKNEKHPDADMYHYTGYQYRYVPNSASAWAEFKAGRLESGSIPAAEVQDYLDDPRVRVAPDATTWRLVTNQFGTTANRDAYIAKHPELGLSETFVPEPILMYKEFRQALFFGFDRISATELVPTYRPATTLYSETYFLDAEGGIGVRGSAEGQAVLDQFGGETAGYVPDAAVALFKSAVAQAIADGHYQKGTSANYTTISLRLTWASSGNINAQTMVAEIKRQYEALLVDDVNFVRVEIDVVDVAFPDNYYSYMMLANTDLGIGGISGSLLDAPDFLDVFRDDNYGGFTLDWGIDTSTANIDVTYVGIDGVEVTERWSANALINALNRKTYVKDGVIQTAWDDAEDLIAAYLDIAGATVESVGEADLELAEAILGGTLADVAEENGYESAEAFEVVTTDGANFLFVLGKNGAYYELISQSALITDPKAAIKAGLDSYGASFTVNDYAKLDDAGVAALEYFEGAYESVADVLEDAGIDSPLAEVWSVSWSYSGGSGSDAVILLHVGDYYIMVEWL